MLFAFSLKIILQRPSIDLEYVAATHVQQQLPWEHTAHIGCIQTEDLQLRSDSFLVLLDFSLRQRQASEGEGDVAFFSAKRWDRRNEVDLIESATLCHDAQVAGSYRVSNPLRLTVLAAKSKDYATTPLFKV